MLEFKNITIEDKKIFDKYLKDGKIEASEYNFTNFFMWRCYYGFKFAEVDNYLCIISSQEGKPVVAFEPIGPEDREAFLKMISKLKEYFNKNSWELTFIRITERTKTFFENISTNTVEIDADRDNSDYIYSTEDMINLKGKKYDGKRNHINRFHKEHTYEIKEINDSNISECTEILKKWFSEKDGEEQNSLYFEMLADSELLNHYNELGCKGIIIEVNGEPEAFTVGEQVNDSSAVVHIEKANSHINGLYPLTNQQFCKTQWSDILFVNREQDLGIEGLRRAKLSYHPAKMIDKYTIKIT